MKIEKNIPIPRRRGNATKYEWHKMEVGESVFIEGANKGISARNAAYTYADSHRPLRFTARVVEGGYRIWRTK